MSLYIVGDIQGCYEPFMRLLDKIKFDSTQDVIWSTGDLVNRGPRSLETLEFFMQLKERALVVLGNHDLHLLAVAFGVKPLKKGDTLQKVLSAPNLSEMVDWLRSKPLLHIDPEKQIALVHAGIPHIWSMQVAQTYAREVEMVLNSDRCKLFLEHMYGNEPAVWSDKLIGWDRLRVITNYFTRMRFCDAKGRLDLQNKDVPLAAPPGYQPWFSFMPLNKDYRIFFGHWAALAGKAETEQVVALDTGCVWGGKLSLFHWEEQKIIHVSCA